MVNTNSNIFEPLTLQATVDAMEPNKGLMLLNSTKQESEENFTFSWDMKFGGGTSVAEFNTPNAKANMVDRTGAKSNTQIATMAYMREADYFNYTNTNWLKDPTSINDPGVKLRGEQKVADQIRHMADRLDNRIEKSLWAAIQGSLNYTGKNTGPLNVDYKFKSSHKPTLGSTELWDAVLADTAAVDFKKLIDNIRGFKKLIEIDGGVEVKEVFATGKTIDLLMDVWQRAVLNGLPDRYITDSQIAEYLSTGTISGGFMGINTWTRVDQNLSIEQPDGSIVVESYLPHGTVVLANRTENSALSLYNGPSADWDSGGKIGRFTKSWVDPDPSGRAFLIEQSFLPVIKAPDQFVVAKVASDTWRDAQDWR